MVSQAQSRSSLAPLSHVTLLFGGCYALLGPAQNGPVKQFEQLPNQAVALGTSERLLPGWVLIRCSFP